MPQQLLLHSPLDMHLHLRDGEMLQKIAKESAYSFCGAIVMPNLTTPVTTKEAVIAYKERIKEAIGEEKFEPYMTLFFKSDFDRTFLESLKAHITAIKLYPAGITTNSFGGVSGFDIQTLQKTLQAMSDLEIPLCIHGETNGFVMDREAEFVPIYERLATAFPKLKIIMEHITTKASVEALERHENLYATITLHHLLITLDDVAGGLLRPHLFCKPIAKHPKDREALLDVALKAHPKVMFGSDSAPHPKEAKETCGCAAGIFTAPIALQMLAELFEKHGSLEKLGDFVSGNAKRIYSITPLSKTVVLEKSPFRVREHYNGVVPMFANETIAYIIKEVING